MRFIVHIPLSEDVRQDLEVLNTNSLITDSLVNGTRPSTLSGAYLADAIGKELTVTIELPPPSNEYAIVQNFEDLLEYSQFLSEPPKNFYEIEKQSAILPHEYKDTVRFGNFLSTISDHVEKSDTKRVCFLYSGAKLRVQIVFSAQDLRQLPNFEEFLQHFNVPYHAEKINFFKSAIVKVGIAAQTETQTFAYLLKHFSVIQKTFENDFNVYLTNFSLEKVLGEIEEKTMKLADKVAASLSDLQKTMITIPLAIIFAAPRLDQQGVGTWTNGLLLISVWLFSLFTWCFFSSQKRNLQFIINEIDEQKAKINESYASLASKLLPKFEALEKRCTDQTCYRRVIGSLMWLIVLLFTFVFLYYS